MIKSNVNLFRLRKILTLKCPTQTTDGNEDILSVQGHSKRAGTTTQNLTKEEQLIANIEVNTSIKAEVPTEMLKSGPSSDPPTSKKVLNLPLLHECRNTHKDNEENRHLGTIQRPHDGNEILRPLVVQAFNRPESDNDVQFITNNDNLRPSSADIDSVSKANAQNLLNGDNELISPFPPVDGDEIDKHKHLNEEAEKNSKSKPTSNKDQSYLKRLNLERKQMPGDKPKDIRAKRKTLKRMHTKPKIQKEINSFYEDKPSPPPKPKEVEAKSIKLILGFRYSYAVEQYYRGKMKQFGSGIRYSIQSNTQDTEEVLNGWIVKSLGPNVLNMQARTLPSCNPIELRLRRQLASMRNAGRSRGRTWSNSSILSAFRLRSRDSNSKLNTIEECQESPHSEQIPKNSGEQDGGQTAPKHFERKVSISQKVDVVTLDKIRDSELVLPPVRSPDKLTAKIPRNKKVISLKLPPIASNDE